MSALGRLGMGVALSALAACAGMVKTSGLSTSGGSPSGGGSSGSSPSSGGGGEDAAEPEQPQSVSYAVGRSQLRALLGKTPDEARQALKGYGHDGKVTVEAADRFHDECGDQRVCGFSAAESGMSVHDDIILYVNPGLSISAPPPP